MNYCFITIEDNTCTELDFLAQDILIEFPNLDVKITESCGEYFVLKVFYDDFEEIQELAATIAYMTVGQGISRFVVTVNSTETTYG